ncbi:MAG: hypothetical protein N2422_03610 [Rhodobacteraceae bacterium]|nr:hypothetical protein [Paracoccaceae bacterium]
MVPDGPAPEPEPGQSDETVTPGDTDSTDTPDGTDPDGEPGDTDTGGDGGDGESGTGPDGEEEIAFPPPPPAPPQPEAPAARLSDLGEPGLPLALNSDTTDTIAALIRQAAATCGATWLRRYRIDCLRVHYLRIADSLPERGDYRAIRAALTEAAARLDRIVTGNLDPAAETVRPRAGNRPAAVRLPAMRAVSAEREVAAAEEAGRVIAETALVILRSGEDPTRRTAHYREIAAAVDNNLVILRSA